MSKEKHFVDNHKTDKTGRFVVRLSLKQTHFKLSNNLQEAINQLVMTVNAIII